MRQKKIGSMFENRKKTLKEEDMEELEDLFFEVAICSQEFIQSTLKRMQKLDKVLVFEMVCFVAAQA